MGKGDIKSKRGKITIGSFGVSRPRKKKKGRKAFTPKANKIADISEQKIEVPEEKKAPKKTVKKAAKKATPKKAAKKAVKKKVSKE